MSFYVFVPFDISISGVCQIARFKHKQHPHSRDNVQGNFEEGDDIPSNPLFLISKQYEKPIRNSHRAAACVEIAAYFFKGRLRGENAVFCVNQCEKIANSNSPHNYADYYGNALPAAELSHLGKFGLFFVRVFVPYKEGDYVDWNPEEYRCCHCGEAERADD